MWPISDFGKGIFSRSWYIVCVCVCAWGAYVCGVCVSYTGLVRHSLSQEPKIAGKPWHGLIPPGWLTASPSPKWQQLPLTETHTPIHTHGHRHKHVHTSAYACKHTNTWTHAHTYRQTHAEKHTQMHSRTQTYTYKHLTFIHMHAHIDFHSHN